MSYSVFQNKQDCCGCTACFAACAKCAITMCADDEGFLYPSVDDSLCVECGICKKTCDFQKEHKSDNTPSVYAVKSDDSIRKNSTSAGMFTLLSDTVLNAGGAVYGAAFDEGMRTVHLRADTAETRDTMRHSKYVQSDMGDTCRAIKKDLENGLCVMFSGTSCQVAGVKSFLAGTDTQNLLLVDILCHGVPSPLAFSEYIKYVEKKRKKKVSRYLSRAKDKGYKFNERIEYADGSREVKTMLGECWNHVFYSDNALRPSCYNCKYAGTDRVSDITIADFWGIEDVAPDFYDTKGVSLVMVNTDKGDRAFDSIRSLVQISEQSFDTAVAKNRNIVKPTACPDSRAAFWNEVKTNGFDGIFDSYLTPIKALKRFIKKILKK